MPKCDKGFNIIESFLLQSYDCNGQRTILLGEDWQTLSWIDELYY